MSAIVPKSQRAHYLMIIIIFQQRKSGRYINVCVLHLTPLAGVITNPRVISAAETKQFYLLRTSCDKKSVIRQTSKTRLQIYRVTSSYRDVTRPPGSNSRHS